MSTNLIPYLKALFSDENFDIGSIGRAGAMTSKYSVDVRRLIKALLEYSWEQAHFADEIVQLLAACDSIRSSVNDLNCSPQEWTEKIKAQCMNPREELAGIRDLAQFYFIHLLVPFRNPGGKRTPQTTVDSTPNMVKDDQIGDLIDQAVTKMSQGALSNLVFKRDGSQCPVSKFALWGDEGIGGRCSHVLPFSLYNKNRTCRAIETFTNQKISCGLVQASINHPRNALNLELQLHKAFDDLVWGIEAIVQPNSETYQYRYRVVVEKRHSPLFRLFGICDGDVVSFGESSKIIDLPDPDFCNLKLDVACILHASGADETINAYERDYEEVEFMHAVHLGSTEIPDELFLEAVFMRTDEIVSGRVSSEDV